MKPLYLFADCNGAGKTTAFASLGVRESENHTFKLFVYLRR